MNAVVREGESLWPMTVADLDAVVHIETAAYEFPWTRGNFIDSLAAGYIARVLRRNGGEPVGYFVAMKGVDEVHLLNLTVAPDEQGRGHARRMLDELVGVCRGQRVDRLWLEVRDSNERARSLYLRYGFVHAGVRKGYYPAPLGRREDASVMSLVLGVPDGMD